METPTFRYVGTKLGVVVIMAWFLHCYADKQHGLFLPFDECLSLAATSLQRQLDGYEYQLGYWRWY